MLNKKQKKIAIIDYGVGNLHSLKKAFLHFGQEAVISEDPDEITSVDAVVLPGVGAFQAGMDGLKIRGLTETVKNFAKTKKPMLGICLGAQIMMGKGNEFGTFQGLDIIPGKVVKFPKLKDKIPHIGWNGIYAKWKVKLGNEKLKTEEWKETILDSVGENSDVYFVHSYILQPSNKKHILATTKYGNYEFCSAIRKDNIYGCQFHPEKSGEVGLKIIKNFINLIHNPNLQIETRIPRIKNAQHR